MPSPMIPTVFCCDICDKSFTQRWILSKHYDTSHGLLSKQPKICKCGKTIDPSVKHYCFECPYCVMKFSSKILLRDHVLSVHPKTGRSCEVCGDNSFTSQQDLIRHVIECRAAGGPQKIPEDKIICEKCNTSVNTFSHYQRHTETYNSLSHKCP